jgi:GDP-4-dehydro-6-deoxy-D-mannose reductase
LEGKGLKILVTGASGFAGRHLIGLLPDSQQIFGLVFPEKPEDVRDVIRGQLLHIDIRREQDVYDVFEKIMPDWVFHFAAVSNVGHSWKNPRETLDINLLGTTNLLEAAKRFAPGARILVVSTSDVYGARGKKDEPFQEEDPVETVNPYAFSKLCMESLCRFYVRIEGLDIIISRSFPHTGPGQSPDFVCSDWACQIARIEKKQKDPVIHVGNIQVKRDYSDVRDVVRAYNLLMEHGGQGEIYNVCCGRTTALDNILNLLMSLSTVEITAQVDKNKLRKTDIPLIIGSNEKIRRTSGWSPKISLDQTLNDLLEYWRKTV